MTFARDEVRAAMAGHLQGAAGRAADPHRPDLPHGGPLAGEPEGLPRRRDRPARGPAGRAGQPALPGDHGVDGREVTGFLESRA